jgi:hypothetical protein
MCIGSPHSYGIQQVGGSYKKHTGFAKEICITYDNTKDCERTAAELLAYALLVAAQQTLHCRASLPEYKQLEYTWRAPAHWKPSDPYNHKGNLLQCHSRRLPISGLVQAELALWQPVWLALRIHSVRILAANRLCWPRCFVVFTCRVTG